MGGGQAMPVQIKAIACMVAGSAVLTFNDALVKWLSAGYPVGEVLFLRGIFACAPLAYFIWRGGGLASLRVRNWRAQLFRAGCMVASTYCIYLGLQVMPMTSVFALIFTQPLMMAAVAGRTLGERVGAAQWAAIAAGFVGVLVMVRPGSGTAQVAALLPLAAAVLASARDLATRHMGATETATSILAVTTTAVTLSGLLSLPEGWSMPDAADFALLALAGVLIGIAHYLIIEAFRLGEAALIAPFKYTVILWTVALDAIVWATLPEIWVFLGAVLVIGSGLYLVRYGGSRPAPDQSPSPSR